MDEMNLDQQAKEMLSQKIDEFDSCNLEGDEIKDRAEAMSKAADVYVKLEQEKRAKKEWIFKLGTILAGVAGVVGAAFVKALFDEKINERNLQYLTDEHERARRYEQDGEVNYIITSPAAKDSLREGPKKF